MSTWSDLPEELLDHILQHLDLHSYGLFAKVCQSWCSAVRVRLTCRPLLVRHLYSENSSEFRFFARWEPGFQQLPFILKCCDQTSSHVGSSMGWMILKAKAEVTDTKSQNRLNFRIVNVISAEEICLPTHTRLRNSLTTKDVVSWAAAAMSSPPTSNDCIVVAAGFVFRGERHQIRVPFLAWCKLGDQDQHWSVLFNKYLAPVSMAFHKGALYILNMNALIHIYTFGVRRTLISEDFYPYIFNWPCNGQFVSSDDGELFLVEKAKEVGFDVYKLGDNDYTRIENLGERVILLTSRRTGLCCSTRDVARGFTRNCIYYYESIAEVLSVYSLEDLSVTTIPLPDQGLYRSIGADWIFP